MQFLVLQIVLLWLLFLVLFFWFHLDYLCLKTSAPHAFHFYLQNLNDINKVFDSEHISIVIYRKTLHQSLIYNSIMYTFSFIFIFHISHWEAGISLNMIKVHIFMYAHPTILKSWVCWNSCKLGLFIWLVGAVNAVYIWRIKSYWAPNWWVITY